MKRTTEPKIKAIVLSVRFPSSGHVCVLRFRPTRRGRWSAVCEVYRWHVQGWCTDEEQYEFEEYICAACYDARERNAA